MSLLPENLLAGTLLLLGEATATFVSEAPGVKKEEFPTTVPAELFIGLLPLCDHPLDRRGMVTLLAIPGMPLNNIVSVGSKLGMRRVRLSQVKPTSNLFRRLTM